MRYASCVIRPGTCPPGVVVDLGAWPIIGAPDQLDPTIHQRPTWSAARMLSSDTRSFRSDPPRLAWVCCTQTHTRTQEKVDPF